jgi:SpoIID/LytB domain protein
VTIGILDGQKSVFVVSSQPFVLSELPPPKGQGRVLAQASPGSVWRIAVGEVDKKPVLALFDSTNRAVAAAQNVKVAAASNGAVRLWSAAEYQSKGNGKAYRGVLVARLRGRSELQVVNVLSLEDYLPGVVPAEIPANSLLAALKAQAIAARSESLAKLGRHKASGFDLCAEEHCQVYGGVDRERPSSTQAVRDTHGIVLTYKGRIVDAVYCGSCGGVTANSEDIWRSSAVPYLRSVSDVIAQKPNNALSSRSLTQQENYFKSPIDACCKPADGVSSNFRWTREMTITDVERWAQAKKKIGKLVSIDALEHAAGGRITKLAIRGESDALVISGEWNVRQFFCNLPSSAFIVETLKDVSGKLTSIKLWGAGWGHGVGMCQDGAIGLAQKGWKSDAILKHYFTGVDLTKRYK